MNWDHLDSDLCQHVITFINTALESPDGPHKGDAKCLALRQCLVTALLDHGLMRGINDLQEMVQESLFQVGLCCSHDHSLIYIPDHVLAHSYVFSSSDLVPALAVLAGSRLHGYSGKFARPLSANKQNVWGAACVAVSVLLNHIESF